MAMLLARSLLADPQHLLLPLPTSLTMSDLRTPPSSVGVDCVPESRAFPRRPISTT